MRNTAATRELLVAFLDTPGTELYGLDIIRSTGFSSGTVYPLLQRLETEGWLRSRWEQIDPSEEGRPVRRLYSITADGVSGVDRFVREVEERKRRAKVGWQKPLPGATS